MYFQTIMIMIIFAMMAIVAAIALVIILNDPQFFDMFFGSKA